MAANRRTAQNPDTPETTPETPETAPQQNTETPAQEGRAPSIEVPFQTVEFDDTQFVPRTAIGRKTGAGRPRSEYMQQLDALLRDRFETGKVGALECDADEKLIAALERKINASAEFCDLGIRFGGYVPSKTEGKIYVTFKVVKRIKRPRKSAASKPE